MLTMADGGWSVYTPGQEIAVHLGNLILDRTNSPGEQLEIAWTYSLPTDPCGYRPYVTVGSDPEQQFAAWLQANKGLRLSAGLLRQFGELTTTEYDVSVVAKDACQYTSPVSVTVAGPGQQGTTFYAGERQRLEVASRNDQLILILIAAPSEIDFDTFEPLAEQVLDSWAWPPSPSPTE
jgi:hypothetical protein